MSRRWRCFSVWLFRNSCGFSIARLRRGEWEGMRIPGFEMRLDYGFQLADQRSHYGLTIEWVRRGIDEQSTVQDRHV